MSQTSQKHSPRPQDIALVKHIVTNNKLFIDTCSLVHAMYPQLENILFPALREAGEKLIVPMRVIDELKRFETDSNHRCCSEARYALKSLAEQQRSGLVSLKGEDSDNFTDNVFLCQFAKFRMHYNLSLITQDVGLAHDLLNLNTVQSQTGNPISVFRITQYGTLGKNSGDIAQQQAARTGAITRTGEAATAIGEERSGNRQQGQNTSNNNPIAEERFYTLKKQITNHTDTLLSANHIPDEGETVRSIITRQDITLVKRLATGGEGSVFATDRSGVVCKIYRKECLTKFRLEKLRRMVGNGFSHAGICWPTDVVLNREGSPIGFLMPQAVGVELQKSLFIPPLLKKHFGSWKKADTVRLALTILEKIRYLHHHNIIIGDINPLNILVNSPEEVYFVDTDSYQIEELPCFVGTVPFSAPEVQRKDFKTFLRTPGNERFAVAVLLFMIMLPGKHPYAQQGGEDPVTNILNMDFSYPLGSKSNKKTPAGQWRFCWSHLPYKIKEAFYETFRAEGQYAKEDERLSVGRWVELFAEYLWLLESGKFAQQDPEAIELFPTRFKNTSSAPLELCKMCGQAHPEDSLQKGYCPDCLKKGTTSPCKKCGKDILHTNYLRLIAQKKPYPLCKDCFQLQSETFLTVRCIECGNPFSITHGEKDFYKEKGFEFPPKRCSACRRDRRAQPVGEYSHTRAPSSTDGVGSIFEAFFNLFK